MQTTDSVPGGYRRNAQGHLVPEANIKAIDLIRDELVSQIITGAKAVAEDAARFKASARDHIQSFVELAAAEHGVQIGGDKGNIVLTSFDGRYRILRAMDETVEFSEGLAVARHIIDGCIVRWSAGADGNLVALIRKAFEADKAGRISVARVLSLLSVEIDDAEWSKAVEIIRQSIQVQASKVYLRCYEREPGGKYAQIPLDGGNL